MNIQKNNIKAGKLDFLHEGFTINLTGEELVRLWALSFHNEGGQNHSCFSRFHISIDEILELSEEELSAVWLDFESGTHTPTY